MGSLRVSYLLLVISIIFAVFLLFPKTAFATDFEVNNEYKQGGGYSVMLPHQFGNIAVPFKVGTEGNYKDFQFMIQQGYYIGRAYGFPSSTPYFDSVSLYPTNSYLDRVKLAILPSNKPAEEMFPDKPEFNYWRSYGDTSSALAVGTKPRFLEPELYREPTHFKWLKFDLESGVQLDTDQWYWAVFYTDSNPDALEEWEFVGMRVVTEYSLAEPDITNVGAIKTYQIGLGGNFWQYLNTGEFVGFRVGKSVPTPVNKTPLIIIPGIGGSEFRSNQDFTTDIYDCGDTSSRPYSYLKDEVIWVNPARAAATGCDDYFDVLKLKEDGLTPEHPQVVLNGTIYSGAYSKLVTFLEEKGYEQNKTLYVFPYDWRKDISLTSPLLNNLISSIKEQTGTQKVDIVAHSMGGLVARKYISDVSQAQNVRKLITLGTPYLGSVEFLKALMYGKWIGPELLGFQTHVGVGPTEIKDLFRNFSGGYQLLPSKLYFNFYSGADQLHPLPFNDVRDLDNNGVNGGLNFNQISNLLENLGHNVGLLQYNIDFGSSIISPIANVETTFVVGSGVPTLGQIKEDYLINFLGFKVNNYDEIMINGDKSVPLLSASLRNESINLSPSSNIFFIKESHARLPSSPVVHELVNNILRSTGEVPSQIQGNAFRLEGQQASSHSPVELHAYDTEGNHTGPTPDGSYEENIPGSYYDTLADTKYIWLPKDGNFTLKLVATDQGHFDLKLRKFENDQNTKTTIYQEVPIQKESRAEIDVITQTSDPQLLQVDQNGDGSFDKQVTFSSILDQTESNDTKAPITSVNFNGSIGSNGWYKSVVLVTLQATDENSGVLKTEYSLDGGFTSSLYSGPLYIDKEGVIKLQFKSTDEAGNSEEVQAKEIKIDKTKPQVELGVNPKILWPPFKQLLKVKITGKAFDAGSGVSFKFFEVEDEYKQVEPKLTDFGQSVWLESWRKPLDWNGRIYRIRVKVSDQAGNLSEGVGEVKVPFIKR